MFKRSSIPLLVAALAACGDSGLSAATGDVSRTMETALLEDAECFAVFEIDFPADLQPAEKQDLRAVFLGVAQDTLGTTGFHSGEASVGVPSGASGLFVVSSTRACEALVPAVQEVTQQSLIWLSNQPAPVKDTSVSARVSANLDARTKTAFE